MDKGEILKKNPKMVVRVINGETILMPLFKTSEQINCIYSLNECGSYVWKLIDGKKTLGQIQEALGEKFSGTEHEIAKELAAYVKDLKEVKAVR